MTVKQIASIDGYNADGHHVWTLTVRSYETDAEFRFREDLTTAERSDSGVTWRAMKVPQLDLATLLEFLRDKLKVPGDQK